MPFRGNGGVPMSELRSSPNPMDLEVGYNVKSKRAKLGLSQAHIAKELGLTVAEYEECESGMRRFGADRLFQLAQLLAVSPQDFFQPRPN